MSRTKKNVLRVALDEDVHVLPDDNQMHRAIKQQYQKLIDAGLIPPADKLKGQKLTMQENADGTVDFSGDAGLLNVLRVMLTANETLDDVDGNPWLDTDSGVHPSDFDPKDAA